MNHQIIQMLHTCIYIIWNKIFKILDQYTSPISIIDLLMILMKVCYSRNISCTLNLISTFFFIKHLLYIATLHEQLNRCTVPVLPFISYGSENIFIIDLYYILIEIETSKESSKVTTILTSNKIAIQNRYIHI